MTEDQNIFDMDLGAVEPTEAPEYSPIKAGPQHVKVNDVVGGLSSQKQTPFIRISHEILSTDKIVAVVEGRTPSTRVSRTFYLTPKAFGILRNAVEAYGVDWNEFVTALKPGLEHLRSGDIDGFNTYLKDSVSSLLIDREADVNVSLESNAEGKRWNEVGKYLKTPTAA